MTSATFDLLGGGTLALERLAERARPDDPFEPGAPFWDDPYVSEQLLDAHLDPERDAASRPHDRIDAEVDWLVSALSLEPGDAVVDLGCGPGLYCERLHDRGLAVTGVDVSRTALDCARRRADESDREITYRRADYRDLDDEDAFDAALLVYFDFGTYADGDRDAVLRSVADALVPGGRFALDVRTDDGWTDDDLGRSWELHEAGGFWRPDPHLVLSETTHYPDEGTYLDQHLVVDAAGGASVYRLPERAYDPATLRSVLTDHGYGVEGVWADLRGTSYTEPSESVGVVARRPPDDGS